VADHLAQRLAADEGPRALQALPASRKSNQNTLEKHIVLEKAIRKE